MNLLDHQPNGQFSSLPESAYEPLKKRFLEEVRASGRVKQACERAGMPVGTLYLLARTDDELKLAMEEAQQVRALHLEALIDDAIESPEDPKHAIHLLHPNLLMFRTKRADPAYKDNFEVNVNIDNRAVHINDWQAAVARIDQTRDQSSDQR